MLNLNLAVFATTLFCRVAATPTMLEYAPDMLSPNLRPPTAEQYIDAGWYHNRVTPADVREGFTALLVRYEVQGDGVVAVYAYASIPLQMPRYSIADLTFWCVTHGKMDAVTAALKEMGYYEVYLTTQEVAADNELFMPALKAIAAKIGVTDAEVEDALAYALIGGEE